MRFHEFNSILIWFPDLFKTILAMPSQSPTWYRRMPNWLKTWCISSCPPTNSIDVFKMKQKREKKTFWGSCIITRHASSPLAGKRNVNLSHRSSTIGTLAVVAFQLSDCEFQSWKTGTCSDSMPSPETSYFSKSSCRRFLASASKHR